MEEQLYEAELNTLNWIASQPGFQAWWSANPISFSAEFRTFIGGLISEAQAAVAPPEEAAQYQAIKHHRTDHSEGTAVVVDQPATPA